MRSFVENELYCLCGKDEITKFMMDYTMKHGNYDIEVPWPQDYMSRDLDEYYFVENYQWKLEFGELPEHILISEANSKERFKRLKNSAKVITKCIINEYAPLILAQKYALKQYLFARLLCLTKREGTMIERQCLRELPNAENRR